MFFMAACMAEQIRHGQSKMAKSGYDESDSTRDHVPANERVGLIFQIHGERVSQPGGGDFLALHDLLPEGSLEEKAELAIGSSSTNSDQVLALFADVRWSSQNIIDAIAAYPSNPFPLATTNQYTHFGKLDSPIQAAPSGQNFNLLEPVNLIEFAFNTDYSALLDGTCRQPFVIPSFSRKHAFCTASSFGTIRPFTSGEALFDFDEFFVFRSSLAAHVTDAMIENLHQNDSKCAVNYSADVNNLFLDNIYRSKQKADDLTDISSSYFDIILNGCFTLISVPNYVPVILAEYEFAASPQNQKKNLDPPLSKSISWMDKEESFENNGTVEKEKIQSAISCPDFSDLSLKSYLGEGISCRFKITADVANRSRLIGSIGRYFIVQDIYTEAKVLRSAHTYYAVISEGSSDGDNAIEVSGVVLKVGNKAGEADPVMLTMMPNYIGNPSLLVRMGRSETSVLLAGKFSLKDRLSASIFWMSVKKNSTINKKYFS